MSWTPKVEGRLKGSRQMGSEHQPIAFRPKVLLPGGLHSCHLGNLSSPLPPPSPPLRLGHNTGIGRPGREGILSES